MQAVEMFRQAEGAVPCPVGGPLQQWTWEEALEGKKEEECKGDPMFPSAWEPGKWCSHWHKGEIRSLGCMCGRKPLSYFKRVEIAHLFFQEDYCSFSFQNEGSLSCSVTSTCLSIP